MTIMSSIKSLSCWWRVDCQHGLSC